MLLESKGGMSESMEEALRLLLETEQQAERIARKADRERQHVIQEALQEVRRDEAQFEARIPELHGSFVEKAETRAEQTINELCKRYDERHRKLRQQAEERESEAVEAAMKLMIDPEL